MNRWSPYTRLLRPHHWIKNTFIFVPILFAKRDYLLTDFVRFVAVFVLFCLLASSLYILNDLLDLKADRLIDEKKSRPLPSGQANPKKALGLAIFLTSISLLGCWWISSQQVFVFFLSYFFLIILYSLWLKKIVLLDVIVLAIGFMIRLLIGSSLSEVPPTVWILLTTFFLALFLSMAKRRHELKIMKAEASQHRATLAFYTIVWLDQALTALLAVIILCYSLFTVSPHAVQKFGSTHLMWTIPCVVYGLFRYLMLIHNDHAKSDIVKVISKDIPLLLCLSLWGVMVMGIVYFQNNL